MIVRLLEITADAAASASSFIRDRRHSAVCEPHPSFKPLDIDARRTHSCQTSPGHVVVLDHAVKILDGARPPSTEQVSTGYPIVLGSNAKLEAQEISMTFADPLVVESADKSEKKMSMSFLSAPSVNVNLTGAGSAIETTLSSIHATAGDLLITMGD